MMTEAEYDLLHDGIDDTVNDPESVLHFLQYVFDGFEDEDVDPGHRPVEIKCLYPEYMNVYANAEQGHCIALVRQANGNTKLHYALLEEHSATWDEPGDTDVDYVDNISHWRILLLNDRVKAWRRKLERYYNSITQYRPKNAPFPKWKVKAVRKLQHLLSPTGATLYKSL